MCVACVGAPLMAQSLRCASTTTASTTLQVEVACNGASVQVSGAVPGATQSFPVGPGKTANVLVPSVPPGTILRISIGCGPGSCVVYVEVVAP